MNYNMSIQDDADRIMEGEESIYETEYDIEVLDELDGEDFDQKGYVINHPYRGGYYQNQRREPPKDHDKLICGSCCLLIIIVIIIANLL